MKIIKWSAISLGFIMAFLGIMFLHFFITSEGEYKVEQTVEQNPSLSHIHIGSSVLHAETFGVDTNDLLIVLHGGPGMDYRYLLPLQELADEYFMVFYDQRGTGLSPRLEAAALSVDQMRSDLHQIVHLYAGDAKVNLIGHSWGALLASVYTNAYPEKVNKVVLAEPWILPIKDELELMEAGMYWFKSLHVRGPDRQAGPDYFFFTSIHGEESSEKSLPEYWRYGSRTRKILLDDPLCKGGASSLDYLNMNSTISDKILFIVGQDHSVPLDKYLINPLNFTHNTREIAIENTAYLFGERMEVSISEIRKFLND